MAISNCDNVTLRHVAFRTQVIKCLPKRLLDLAVILTSDLLTSNPISSSVHLHKKSFIVLISV